MASINEIVEELNFLSETLSERTRVLSVGIIAIWWTTLIGGRGPPGLGENALLGPAICAAVSALLDVLQYAAGYLQSYLALYRLEKLGLSEVQYDRHSLLFRLREFLFLAKQVAALAAIAWLILILFRKFLT